MGFRSMVLVVEDDPKVIIVIADRLEFMGYQVLIARNGVEGIKKAREERPDLILLDVMMPEMDGYEVCRQLKSEPKTKQIPILMLTAKGQLQDKIRGFDVGADDYLAKPPEMAEFDARVRALLRRQPVKNPFNTTQNDSFISFYYRPAYRINIRVSGTTVLNSVSKGILDIDADAFSRQGNNIPLLDWRFSSKQQGKQLFQQCFINHPEVLTAYHQTLGDTKSKELLHLRFETQRDLLRLPLESLYDEINDGGEYLVLQHPFSRSVNGIRVMRESLSPQFFNDLVAKDEALRVLLVASNTFPSIPGVDQEISVLDSSIKSMFEKRGIRTEVETIPTDKATHKTIKEILQKCKYHIFHYAGHGTYDTNSSEKSSLVFWEKDNRQGSIKKMAVSELELLLRGSDLRFAYLSCCWGTKVGEPHQLLDDDFLGITDGIIHAGVPSALGFRWPVSDSGAQNLAYAFYKSLANQGKIDTALLDARCEIAMEGRDDITWLSPILIMQT